MIGPRSAGRRVVSCVTSRECIVVEIALLTDESVVFPYETAHNAWPFPRCVRD